MPSGGSQEGENLVSEGENMSAKIIFLPYLYIRALFRTLEKPDVICGMKLLIISVSSS